MLTGIAFGPHGAKTLDPLSWVTKDDILQEITRVIAGLQVFVVGLELPSKYLRMHYGSIMWLLGPIMAFGWLMCGVFIHFLFGLDWPDALVVSACLTPTDPVLAASILSNSHFSTRVPVRIKHLLSAESGCNDGAAFPFLYVGLSILTQATPVSRFKKWALICILWQCAVGIIVGIVFGIAANWALRFSDQRRLIGPASFQVFYLVLAIVSIGIGSTLGLDDFLVAFFAGAAFSHDGWFAKRTKASHLNLILDLIVNSTFFVYFGTMIPWEDFKSTPGFPKASPGKLVALLVLVLAFRRIPAVLALKPFIKDIRTWPEALFAGHFGPMGVGALFLSMEARAQLETGESIPLPSPDDPGADHRNRATAKAIFPIVAFVVMGSTLVHGLSVAAISIATHLGRPKHDRAEFPGAEREPLGGMDHVAESEQSESDGDYEEEWEERSRRIVG